MAETQANLTQTLKKLGDLDKQETAIRKQMLMP